MSQRNITQLKIKNDGSLHVEWIEESSNYSGEDTYKVDFVEAPRPEFNEAIRNLVSHITNLFEIDTTNADCSLVKVDYSHQKEMAKYELQRKVKYIDEPLTIKTGWSNDVDLETIEALLNEVDKYVNGDRKSVV